MSDAIKYLLPKAEILKDWYNLIADLPELPPAVFRLDTHEPLGAVAS